MQSVHISRKPIAWSTAEQHLRKDFQDHANLSAELLIICDHLFNYCLAYVVIGKKNSWIINGFLRHTNTRTYLTLCMMLEQVGRKNPGQLKLDCPSKIW